MKVQPLNDKVIIKRVEASEVSVGGVFIPEQARESTKRGVVIGVGPGKVLLNGEIGSMPVQEGDEVLYDYGGVGVSIEEQPYLIIAARDLLAVINRED